MNFFRWLERQTFTGEIVRDYGPIYQTGSAIAGETHTLLLCRKSGRDWIVIRHSRRAVLGFSVSYTQIPAELAGDLSEKFADISARTSNENA